SAPGPSATSGASRANRASAFAARRSASRSSCQSPSRTHTAATARARMTNPFQLRDILSPGKDTGASHHAAGDSLTNCPARGSLEPTARPTPCHPCQRPRRIGPATLELTPITSWRFPMRAAALRLPALSAFWTLALSLLAVPLLAQEHGGGLR